jgi:PIN domain nuclease of toxin-antitoxin system
VRLLLDTHILIWTVAASKNLSAGLKDVLADPENAAFVSVASVWEISIKQAAGKLHFPLGQIDDILIRMGYGQLPIYLDHALAAGQLPLHHRDPFDRMLIAQAQIEDLTLVSQDEAFAAYGIPLLGN